MMRRPFPSCGDTRELLEAGDGISRDREGTIPTAAVPLTSMVALATGELENTNTHRYSPDSSARAFGILQQDRQSRAELAHTPQRSLHHHHLN